MISKALRLKGKTFKTRFFETWRLCGKIFFLNLRRLQLWKNTHTGFKTIGTGFKTIGTGLKTSDSGFMTSDTA